MQKSPLSSLLWRSNASRGSRVIFAAFAGAAFAGAALACVACGKSVASQGASLGEPVGVRVDDVKDQTGKPMGSLQGAFAVSAGQAAEPLVPGMARAMSSLGKKCGFLFGRVTDPIRLRGTVEGGTLSFAPATEHDGAEARCVRDTLDGQKVSESAIPAKLDFGFELREVNTK